ncbi:MAG: hypothetical protein P0Y65_17260 [Candidatus Devosia phytovorans]|uniref:Uncharacterized protein n=1 Tax=Candidatus Devosia phytovorans TaxID=3121372 RepID=A0AAJ5VV22_9HYPH|nr:hypothetical protein [Devosia sp.]WEK03919.1 MAG: hypothetical protein P0Y65_17260 [Devosia sp.]
MKFVKTFAIAATLVAGVSAANASTLNTTLNSYGDISSARSASVLTVNETEAKLLGYDTDVHSIRARVENNQALVQTLERQGFTVDQIVGATGGENDLTLFAL